MKYSAKQELYYSQLADVGLLRPHSSRHVLQPVTLTDLSKTSLSAETSVSSPLRPRDSVATVEETGAAPPETAAARPRGERRTANVYKWWRRQRFVIVVVFAIGVGVQVYSSIDKLLNNSTISTVRWKPFEDGFPLPAVTVCSYSTMSSNLSLADFVKDCKLINDNCEEAMGKTLEVTVVVLAERRCFTFKSSENAPLNEKNNGIEMTVAFQPTDVRKDKIEIYLHGKNQDYNPFYVLGLERNIELPLGKVIKVELMVEMSTTIQNGADHGCRQDASYSYVDCIRFCFEQRLIEMGPKCRLDWMMPRSSAPLCADPEDYRNLSQLVSDHGTTIARDFPECEAGCEQACQVYSYRGVEYSSLLNDKLLAKRQGEFRFKFRDTSYTAIEEVVSYDFWSMIGEVGGTLGFLLGLSLLSILDLIADAIKLVHSWGVHRRRRARLIVRAKY